MDNPIPNIEFLGACYDVVAMDPLNLGRTALPQNVFDLSEPSGVKTSIGGHDVPKGIQWRKILATNYDSLSGVLSSASDFHDSIQSSVKVNAGVKGAFEFSGSASFKDISKETNSRKRSFVYTRAVAEIHSVYAIIDRQSGLKLSPSFLDAVAQLPDSPDDVESPRWSEFVKRFGTHFASAVTLGGMAVQRTSGLATRFLRSEESKRELEAKAKVVIDKLNAGASASQAQESARAADSDDKLDRTRLEFQGGVGTVTGITDQWINSLSDDPTIVSGQFKKITELLTDHFFPNDAAIWTKRQVLEFAIKDWITQHGEPSCFTAPLEYGESLLPMRPWTDGKTLRAPAVYLTGAAMKLVYQSKDGKPMVESPQPANIVLENASGSRGKRPVLAGDELFLKHAPTGNYLSGDIGDSNGKWRPDKSAAGRFIILHAGDTAKGPMRLGEYFTEADPVVFVPAPLGRDGGLCPNPGEGALCLFRQTASFTLIRWDPRELDEGEDEDE
jgi:hypothetical protein